MNIIIVGGGKVGTTLSELLAKEGHNVTIIDTAPKLVENIVNNQDVIGYCGNGASFPVQCEAGIDKCDVFIAVTGSDELNISLVPSIRLPVSATPNIRDRWTFCAISLV